MPSTKEYVTGPHSRGLFLSAIVVGFGAIAGVVLGIPIIGYVLTPLIKPAPEAWRDVGAVTDFIPGIPSR